MIIYKTTNLLNGKIYIGQDTKNRPSYLGSGKLLNMDIKKEGKTNFKKEVLEHCSTVAQLNKREKYWIKKLNTTDKNIGYNILKGGAFDNKGTVRVDITENTKNAFNKRCAELGINILVATSIVVEQAFTDFVNNKKFISVKEQLGGQQ